MSGLHDRIYMNKFCFVSLIGETKNQLKNLGGVKILSSQKLPFIVHFIGNGDEKYINKMKQYIPSFHIEHYVQFWGYRDDVTDILKQMDIGVIPSLNEAFGRVTVEYMMESMPVIGANSGGTPELVKDGETGYLYEVGNARCLAEKMETYIVNKKEIATHGMSARRYAVSNFDIKQNTDNIYRIYQKVCI